MNHTRRDRTPGPLITVLSRLRHRRLARTLREERERLVTDSDLARV